MSHAKIKIKRKGYKLIDSSRFEWILKISLILASIYFVKEMVDEFLKENTRFSVTEQTITKDDFPTLTVCLIANAEMLYGKDYKIQIMNSPIAPWDQDSANTSLITLRNGTNGYDFITGKREITQ